MWHLDLWHVRYIQAFLRHRLIWFPMFRKRSFRVDWRRISANEFLDLRFQIKSVRVRRSSWLFSIPKLNNISISKFPSSFKDCFLCCSSPSPYSIGRKVPQKYLRNFFSHFHVRIYSICSAYKNVIISIILFLSLNSIRMWFCLCTDYIYFY